MPLAPDCLFRVNAVAVKGGGSELERAGSLTSAFGLGKSSVLDRDESLGDREKIPATSGKVSQAGAQRACQGRRAFSEQSQRLYCCGCRRLTTAEMWPGGNALRGKNDHAIATGSECRSVGRDKSAQKRFPLLVRRYVEVASITDNGSHKSYNSTSARVSVSIGYPLPRSAWAVKMRRAWLV